MEGEAAKVVLGLEHQTKAMDLLGRDFSTLVYIFQTFFPQLHHMVSEHPRLIKLLPIFLAAYMGTSAFTTTLGSWKTTVKSALLKFFCSSVTLEHEDRLYDAFLSLLLHRRYSLSPKIRLSS